MAAVTRAASAEATALVARLVANDELISGADAELLRIACAKVSTLGSHFGARYAALVNVSALLPGFTDHEVVTTKAFLAQNLVNFFGLQRRPQQPRRRRGAPQQQRDVDNHARPALEIVGSPEWTAGLIRQIQAAMVPAIPVAVPELEVRAEQWADTDSEGPGF